MMDLFQGAYRLKIIQGTSNNASLIPRLRVEDINLLEFRVVSSSFMNSVAVCYPRM
jgi:hypothetical protein